MHIVLADANNAVSPWHGIPLMAVRIYYAFIHLLPLLNELHSMIVTLATYSFLRLLSPSGERILQLCQRDSQRVRPSCYGFAARTWLIAVFFTVMTVFLLLLFT